MSSPEADPITPAVTKQLHHPAPALTVPVTVAVPALPAAVLPA